MPALLLTASCWQCRAGQKAAGLRLLRTAHEAFRQLKRRSRLFERWRKHSAGHLFSHVCLRGILQISRIESPSTGTRFQHSFSRKITPWSCERGGRIIASCSNPGHLKNISWSTQNPRCMMYTSSPGAGVHSQFRTNVQG